LKTRPNVTVQQDSNATQLQSNRLEKTKWNYTNKTRLEKKIETDKHKAEDTERRAVTINGELNSEQLVPAPNQNVESRACDTGKQILKKKEGNSTDP